MNKIDLIIGVGNQTKGDDAIGIYIIDQLKEKNVPAEMLIKLSGDISRILDYWENKNIILIDAIYSDQLSIGQIWESNDINQVFDQNEWTSFQHGLGLNETLGLAIATNKLPSSLHFFGICGKSWKVGIPISYAVVSSSQQVMNTIITNLNF